jgi:hypothetical protein
VTTKLDAASGLLSVVVLADSALEHYRGGFYNPVMFAAPLLSSMALGTSVSARPGSSATFAHVLALAGGTIGTGFHIFNVIKREGGVSRLNLFYGAPIAAPLALTFSGLVGLCADRLRKGKPLGRLFAAATAAGLAGTAAEAGLLHFRGAFHNKLMFVPITIPPAAALFLARDAVRGQSSKPARALLRATVFAGLAGTGGWKNISQNIHAAPPIPAPPAFTAMALADRVALELIDDGVRRSR